MSVELGQAKLLRQWFTPVGEGGEETDVPDRTSMSGDIEQVSGLLAELWFSADYAWTQWSDDDVLTVLRQWLDGSDEEAGFREYAVAGHLAEFIDWLKPAIVRWQAQEAQASAEQAIENADYDRDPITGTRYYRWVQDRAEYLYADNPAEPYVPDGTGWLTMDERIEAQDPTQPHYDPSTGRWRRPAAEGGVYEYQHRGDKAWERTDGSSWLREHSKAAGWLPYDKDSGLWFYQNQWRADHEITTPPRPAGTGAGSQVGAPKLGPAEAAKGVNEEIAAPVLQAVAGEHADVLAKFTPEDLGKAAARALAKIAEEMV
jgi:hypothetical protein